MTAADPRIAIVEAALTNACDTALARGAVLIRDAFEAEFVDADGCVRPCVCAWGASDLTGIDPGAGLADSEYDAIEHGWDGAIEQARRDQVPMAWYDLGARLAQRFHPVPVSTLEAP